VGLSAAQSHRLRLARAKIRLPIFYLLRVNHPNFLNRRIVSPQKKLFLGDVTKGMTSSNAFPFGAQGVSEPFISPALSDDTRNAFIGKARIKDVEAKLGV
jgi:hypothetical protein